MHFRSWSILACRDKLNTPCSWRSQPTIILASKSSGAVFFHLETCLLCAIAQKCFTTFSSSCNWHVPRCNLVCQCSHTTAVQVIHAPGFSHWHTYDQIQTIHLASYQRLNKEFQKHYWLTSMKIQTRHIFFRYLPEGLLSCAFGSADLRYHTLFAHNILCRYARLPIKHHHQHHNAKQSEPNANTQRCN